MLVGSGVEVMNAATTNGVFDKIRDMMLQLLDVVVWGSRKLRVCIRVSAESEDCSLEIWRFINDMLLAWVTDIGEE